MVNSAKIQLVSSGVIVNQNGLLGFSEAFMVREPRLKSSKNREDNLMYSGIVRTALTNGLPLELDYRKPREVRPNARSQAWAVNSEEYFAVKSRP